MIAFEKWQGLGNDFILVDQPVSPSQAMALCDRRLGIGADGVLVMGERDGVRSMLVLNADGSRPEMCGNGLRCVAGYLASRQPHTRSITIATDAGLRECEVEPQGALWQVTADMGRAHFTGDVQFPTDAPSHNFSLVDVGNPHAVTFERYGSEAVEAMGPALESHIPGGINVELCRTRDDGGIDVLVWERGVGLTQACGTGACAVAAVACKDKHANYDTPISVYLPGGPLQITVTRIDQSLSMRGPAEHVFRGLLG